MAGARAITHRNFAKYRSGSNEPLVVESLPRRKDRKARCPARCTAMTDKTASPPPASTQMRSERAPPPWTRPAASAPPKAPPPDRSVNMSHKLTTPSGRRVLIVATPCAAWTLGPSAQGSCARRRPSAGYSGACRRCPFSTAGRAIGAGRTGTLPVCGVARENLTTSAARTLKMLQCNLYETSCSGPNASLTKEHLAPSSDESARLCCGHRGLVRRLPTLAALVSIGR